MSVRVNPVLAVEFSWQLAGLDRPEDYYDSAAALLGALIPSAGVSRGQLDSTSRRYDHRGWPPEAFVIWLVHQVALLPFARRRGTPIATAAADPERLR